MIVYMCWTLFNTHQVFDIWLLGPILSWAWGLIALIFGALLLPPITIIIGSIYSDSIVDHIEKKYYPSRLGMRQIKLSELGFSISKNFCITITVNILLAPLYLIGTFFPIISFLIFYCFYVSGDLNLNSWQFFSEKILTIGEWQRKPIDDLAVLW